MRKLTGWLMVAGALLAGFASLLGVVSGILSLPKALGEQSLSYLAGMLAGHLVIVIVLFVLSQKLMKAGRARLIAA